MIGFIQQVNHPPTWAESVSTDEEIELDDAYNKPMIMLADWSSYDGEYIFFNFFKR